MAKQKLFKPKTANRLLKNPKVLVACAVIAAVGTILLINSRAASFCDIAPANDTLVIEAAINGCSDGSTIRFPANSSYSLNDTIFVKDRNNLVIDGRNSTFTITVDGETKPSINRIAPGYNANSYNGGNWMLLRGTNITLKNINAIGSFPPGLNGEVRDITKENRPEYVVDDDGDGRIRYTESMSNFGVYGTNGAYLEDLTGKAPWGDTITTATDHYVDNFYNEHGGETRTENGTTTNLGNYAQNVHAKRVRSEETSRMCFALTSGRNMYIEDSYCKSAWYGGTDQEIDEVRQPLEGVHFLRNTFEGFNLFGYLLPVAGINTRDITVNNNTFLTPTDTKCNPTIGMGGYPDNPDTIKNISIQNNTIITYGNAISLDSIAGGMVRNNKITSLAGGGCGSGGSDAPLVKVTSRSTGVIQENNGPNAPGSGVLAPPPAPGPSPLPPPSPAPLPSPSPTPPPPTSGCSAPANFDGSPGPNGSGQYNFTWQSVTGVTDYSLRIGTSGSTPESAYATGFTSNSATAFGLVPGQMYNFAVRAHCGASMSINSNVLAVVAPANTPPPNTCTGKPASDINCDGTINAVDISSFRQKYKATDPIADINKDGAINAIDISAFRQKYKSGT